MTRSPTAAGALYPHLKSCTPDVVQRRQQGSVADAMYLHLKPPQPKPPPESNRYRESEVSLATRCDENPQLEWLLGMSGLRRKR
jgi:hypothetical protein